MAHVNLSTHHISCRGSSRVGAGVGHGQETWSCVLLLEVLIAELLSVDRLASSALGICQTLACFSSLTAWNRTYVAASEVTTLKHELRNDSMELAALVSEAVFAGA